MKTLDLAAEPHLVDSRIDDRKRKFPDTYELDVVLGPGIAARSSQKISLAAVIEEKDGIKSYWALAHPAGGPNFHHPACFTALPPAIATA